MKYVSNICFTINNYTQTNIDQLLTFKCRYIIFAKEIAPTTGTPHLQGYCEFHHSKELDYVRRLGIFGHCDPVISSQEDAINYIKDPQKTKRGKEKNKLPPLPEDLYEVGGPKKPRVDSQKDTNWKKALYLIQEGIIPDPEDDEINAGVLKNYEILQSYCPNLGKRPKPRVTWYYGKGGSGKTQRAYDLCGPNPYKCDMLDVGWMQGYNGQKDVIIDDFNPDPDNATDFKLLLQMLDKYPLQMNKKGSSCWFKPNQIVITSQDPPWKIYCNAYWGDGPGAAKPGPELFNKDVKLRQLMRRIDKVEQVKLEEGIELTYPELINV